MVIVNDRKNFNTNNVNFFQYQNLKCKKNEYCMIYMNLLDVYLVIQLHLCVAVCQKW